MTFLTADNATRVKLSPIEGVEGSDYINASWIADSRFIATQAPLHNTIDDFYRMLWEQNVPIVIVLVPVAEIEKDWLDNAPENVTVTVVSSEEHEGYSLRDVRMEHDNETRNLRVYHFLEWPKDDLPNLEVLLKFFDCLSGETAKPQVIHCRLESFAIHFQQWDRTNWNLLSS